MPENNSFNPDEPVRGDILKKAIEKSDYLTKPAIKLVIKDLEHQGIVFDDKNYHKLDAIHDYFAELVGNDVAALITERLKTILDDIKWTIIATVPTIQLGMVCMSMSCICFICNCLRMGNSGTTGMMGNM
jgi:hypothetical protein